jgi:hypothetical protein
MSFSTRFVFTVIYEAATVFGWNPAPASVIAQPNRRFARIKE